MASADDPAEMSAGAVNDGISPGGAPRPTPPRAKRRRVEDEEGEPVMSAEEEAYFRGLMQEMLRKPQMQEMLYPYFPETMRNPESFEMLLTDPTYKPVWKEIGVPTLKAFFESHSAPDLPDEILHLIFSRAALDPRGGMPAVLAARGVCRSWRRAASSPALWRDIALRRWGFCADPGGDESEGYDQDADRALCLRLARAPEAPVSYARGRWHRAVAAARTFRVAFCDARAARCDVHRRAATRTRRANLRAHGTTSAPRYLTRDPPVSRDAAADAARNPHLEPPFWRGPAAVDGRTERNDERAPSAGIRDRADVDDVGRTAWHVAEVSASEPGAVVVADHALVLHVRDLPWKRLARNLTCGLACVAVDAEVTDDEAEEERDPRCALAYGARSDEETETRASNGKRGLDAPPKKRGSGSGSRWVRLCQLWVRVGVTLTRCGATRSDARLFLDGYARVSHAAPSRYSRELFGDGDDSRRNRGGGYHQTRRPFDRDDDDRLRELESLRRAYRAIDASTFPPGHADVDVDVGHPWNPRSSLPNAGVSTEDRLLLRVVPLEVANDARLAENDGRRDVDAAAVASSSLTAIASEFVCAVSFTSDDAMDTARELKRQELARFAPAIVAATLGVPRTFRGSPLATFRVGGGAAAEAARAFERVPSSKRGGLKCHLSFTHKSGVGYVYAAALRPDAAPPEDASAENGARRGASRSPRAVHFSERHRFDAAQGTGSVFAASELEHDVELDGPVVSETFETETFPTTFVDPETGQEYTSHDDFECRRWEGGPDRWKVTADVDPAARESPFADAHPFRALSYSEHVNWTREPRDDARAHGFFTSAGFDTGLDIDRVELPRMIQAHEASVSVGHALLITVPFSALVAASGRAVLTKTAREMRER